MAQRKQQELQGENKRSVAQKARRARELRAISELADQNLASTDEWRTLRPEHLAVIKFRLLGGDTLGNICRDLGIERTTVCQHIYENPDYAREYLAFKAFGAHALYEKLLELPFDDTMRDADKLLYFKVVSNYAPKINREVYGDRLDVNATQTVQVQMPTWLFGQVQDGQQIEHQGDPDALEGISLPGDAPKLD